MKALILCALSAPVGALLGIPLWFLIRRRPSLNRFALPVIGLSLIIIVITAVVAIGTFLHPPRPSDPGISALGPYLIWFFLVTPFAAAQALVWLALFATWVSQWVSQRKQNHSEQSVGW